MRLFLILLGLAAAIGLAGPAYADSSDDAFLATVHAAGLTYSDPDQAITSGRSVCTLVGEGSQLADIVRMIQMLNRGLQGDDATRFAAIAANSYCPQALSAPNAAS
ncbi:DUF732 domain-containing protein [Mycobacterium nebraskense]|uniref:DUF732 domain-containing protein n=1 Tax=Mycobacterium nebraskense TaxID=244292 RepID=A0A0F5N7L1_9MYCO|nr:DUF732 domain-containing protein [Mycobacterium nebraskense]KKC02937.1 hypothetical protein WU83_21615 [Mycobacterium nebraskense]KLO39948.1 hypothetical protein ABW17_18490 [Mycobacterium nebraskense]MBI2693909.1 DUF732 domain-containing protein [Mycobacterium nebraskense]MCV7120568.1 DUF732 domain-containing protein [Mycobacterium nebraskense]ORW21943.1 hypothetical protein AWC17_00120 [Mycobacterium nebraskense]